MQEVIIILTKDLISILLTGFTIKLMDDYLDQEIDKLIGKKTLAGRLNKAVIPYALLLFSFAVALNSSWAISLFWASYILGMGYDLKNSLPTKLESYQESLFLLIISLLFVQFNQMVSSLLVIFNIQLIDDLIDYNNDMQAQRNNFIHILGRRQVILLIIIISSTSAYLALKKTLLVLLVAPVITFLLEDEGGEYYKDR
ncbi:UbiA prenyltransferase family protein [Selenihalanaerobacter shriftii]|uniref:UbiA prenyltransferase family protein n=1 Tax=Selenihalanaerobacter shriftii TaxID=142842 RepID=A0A1T4LZU8_9FIRM|nr:hypothetical protein [Selenihalanaerobacter shriftii]SJZ60186.1 hypothetical protein SAMN02745118_01320 [Selenihalanaerobacter shriftii]